MRRSGLVAWGGVLVIGAVLLGGVGAPRVAGAAGEKSAATAPAAVSAGDLLRRTFARYDKLNSFSTTIRHQDSSGLFPGAYRQELKWRKGGRFTLRVTKRADLSALPAEHPGGPAPDYYADGTHVVSDLADGERWIDGIKPDPGTTPGWEVAGGFVLSRLQQTGLHRILFEPQSGMRISYSYGPRTRWQGLPVREIIGTMGMEQEGPASPSMHISFFVSPDGTRFVGFEAPQDSTGKKLGYTVYTDQKFNPALPTQLGAAPKQRPGVKVTDWTKMKKAPARPADPPLLANGTVAPDFTAESADGTPIKLSDLRGKVVVLDFWATWCGPCVASMPHTNEVAGKFPNGEVVVLAVTNESKEKLTGWLEGAGAKYTAIRFVREQRATDTPSPGTLYKVSGIPTQYVIGPDGKIVLSLVGYGGPTDDLEKAVRSALASSAAGAAPPSSE